MLQVNGIAIHAELLEPTVPATGEAVPARLRGYGSVPTLVMVHGMGTDTMASWYFTLALPLSQAGLRVLMYDLRGHGHSQRPPTGYGLDDHVADLAGVLDQSTVDGPILLLGNSFGGTIAFSYALRHPERVVGVVAIESAPPTEGWIRRVVRRLELAADFLPRDEALAEISASRGDRIARRAGMARELLGATTLLKDVTASPLPSREAIAGLDVPVLCLYGGASGVAEFEPVVRALLPRVSTAVVPDQRHTLLIDQPERVRELVTSWLSRERRVDAGRDAARA